MASNNQDSLPSPSHLAMSGHDFTPEDIHDLLGGVFDGAESAEGDTDSKACSDVPTEAKTLARTERKRSREKQRRCDVNKQLAALTTLLRRIEGEEPEDFRLPAYSPSNRADLIARAILILSSLHESNKRRKTEIAEIKKELEIAQKAGEETAAKLKESMMAPQSLGNNKVMMMVPMMIGGENGAIPMMSQWMPPQSGVPAWNPYMSAPSGNASESSQSGAGSNSAGTHVATPATMPMPWMMPSPWMMPTPQQVMAAPVQPTTSREGATKTDKDNESSVESNLAHCA